MQLFEQQIGDQGGDDLEADGLGVFGQEALDLEVLLDPFEEEFDLPAPFVEIGDLFGGALEIICDEGDFTAFVFIENLDPAQGLFVFASWLSGQGYDLIGHDQRVGIELRLVHIIGQIGLWPGDEEGLSSLDIGPEFGLIVSPVKDIGSAGDERQALAQPAVMEPRRGDLKPGRGLAIGIEQQMQLDGAVVGAKAQGLVGLGKQRQCR